MPSRRQLYSLATTLATFGARLPVALAYGQRAALAPRPRSAVLTLRTKARAAAKAVATEAPEAAAAVAEYDHGVLEAKWQQYWEEQNTFATRRREGKEKKYVLDMFPYPSGAGLHVGHPEGYTASDIMARYWRMRDYDVLHPMGWDSFGLPAEQHAINTGAMRAPALARRGLALRPTRVLCAAGTHPEETTKLNIANFKRQLKSLGFSYDWGRELATTDVNYVR